MHAAAVGGLAALLIGAMGLSACSNARATERGLSPPMQPVIVELFTSEGCSSCPPADRVLAELEAKHPLPGVEIVPLAFHVDYWDELGWKDPYSSRAWTKRQLSYRRGERPSLYTPQLVVAGADELNGGDREGALRAIRAAAARPRTSIALTTERRGSLIDVTATIGARSGNAPVDALLAWVEPHVRVNVTSGENAGRSLDHTSVVRGLVPLGVVPPKGGELKRSVAASEVPTGSRLVVFVQERTSRAIVGAATAASP